MTEKPLRSIGILGGTFDPIHYGHLKMAAEIKKKLCLQEMRLVPCHQPPHRDNPATQSKQRLTMVQMALASWRDSEGLIIDDRELNRNGPSYTIDTIQSLRDELGSQTIICLVLGLDAFYNLPEWYRWRDLLSLCHIIVMTRPGWQSWSQTQIKPAMVSRLKATSPDPPNAVKQINWQDLVPLLAQHQVLSKQCLVEDTQGCIYLQSVSAVEISASVIRNMAFEGKSIHDLVPSIVCEYIKEQGLYR